MDIQAVLEATFAVPSITPDWQAELLLRLGASETDEARWVWPSEPDTAHLLPGLFPRTAWSG